MKQPEDTKTLELSLAEAKRGRGRPVKPDALTPAERAKRYRAAKRAGANAIVKSDVTEKAGLVSPEEYMRVKRMYWSLEGQVDLANAERDAAFKANAELTRRIDELERDLRNAEAVSRINEGRGTEEADRCIALQRKLDLEHLARVEAENQLATIAATKPAKARTNPLAKRVAELERALEKRDAEHSAIMQAMQEEHQAKAAKQRTSKSR